MRREVREITSRYIHDFSRLLARLDPEPVARVVERLASARDAGTTVYVAGNGGSAAIASHWVNDLGKATKRSGHAPIRVVGLTDNVSWLTALANDEGYDRVFAGQLENFARPGDVLVAISSSGHSVNLLRAVELARSRGVFTIGFLGFDGGVLRKEVDDYVLVETEKGAYSVVEPAHDLLCHLVTRCLTEI